MNRRPGFTLIELLIVTAVFSLVALVATTVITRIQTTQRQILGKQRVVADGRYVLETIARAVRQGTVDYSVYANSANPQSVLSTDQQLLAIINQTGTNGATQYICYRFCNGQIQTSAGSSSCPSNANPTTNANACATSTGWINITPSDLVITNLSVWISPRSDPFGATPIQDSDCATVPSGPVGTYGFDGSRGVCACRPNTPSDCFPSQQCMSTTAGNIGMVCGAGDTTCICQNANQQPEVTIMIGTDSRSQAAGEGSHSNLQTTIASHLYRR